MKSVRFTLMLLAVCVGLVACSNQVKPASDAPSAPPESSISIALDSGERNNIERCCASTESGYYNKDIYFEGGASVSYIDYASKSEVFLCAKPNCTHDNENCNAFYPYDGQTMLSGVLATENGLLAIQCVADEKTNPHIDCLDFSGDYQRCLVEFNSNQQIAGNIESDFYTDGKYLYFVLSKIDTETSAVKSSLVAVDLDSGAVHSIYESADGVTQLTICEAFDHNFVFLSVEAENIAEINYRYCILNLESGEMTDLPYQMDEEHKAVPMGHYEYVLDVETEKVLRIDLRDNSSNECDLSGLFNKIREKYNEMRNISLYPQSFNMDYCRVGGVVVESDGQYREVTYMVDLCSGNNNPFTLYKEARPTEIVRPICETPYGLFVKTDWKTVSLPRSDGGNEDVYVSQWAIMESSDYLSSTPDFDYIDPLDFP